MKKTNKFRQKWQKIPDERECKGITPYFGCDHRFHFVRIVDTMFGLNWNLITNIDDFQAVFVCEKCGKIRRIALKE